MRFAELGINTQRHAPKDAHSEGEALLVRAGYLNSDRTPTGLGQRALDRIREAAAQSSLAHFLRTIRIAFVAIEDAGTRCYYGDSPLGQTEVLHCRACEYAALPETTRIPPIPAADTPQLPLERAATPGCGTIDALAAYLDVPKSQTAKAIMLTSLRNEGFILALVRGDRQLSRTKLEQLVGPTRAATESEITESGAVPGYASALGLSRGTVVADAWVVASRNLISGANEAGYHFLNMNYGRDFSADVVGDIITGAAGDPCPNCGRPLARTMMLPLGTDDAPEWQNVLLAIAEGHHDRDGLNLPPSIAPFQAHLVSLPGGNLEVEGSALALYNQLQASGALVLFDDRSVSAGVKFKDADLIGLPVRIVASERNLVRGMVELRRRGGSPPSEVPVRDASSELQALLSI